MTNDDSLRLDSLSFDEQKTLAANLSIRVQNHQRDCALKEFFRRKGRGMAESAGEMPTRNFMNPAGWWAELTEHERTKFTGLIFLVLYHLISVSMCFMTMTTGDISYVIIGCHFTWGGNVGDLLIHFLSITPNFHGARRTDQLVIHHMVSIICIPAFVILEVPQDTLTRFQLLLEMSGGLSSLVVALSLTPAINSVLHFWFLLWFNVSLVYHRCWEWSLVGIDVIFWSYTHQHPIITLFITICGIALSQFNWMMVEVHYKRLGSALSTCSYQSFASAADYPYIHIGYSFISTLMAYPVNMILLFTTPLLLSPYTNVEVPIYILFGIAGYVLFFIVRHIKDLTTRKQTGRVTRREFTSFEQCKEVLHNPFFSPAPYRYRHPKPFMKPFAEWVRSMLLYNDEGHMRLKHSYPKLNHVKHVIENYEQILNYEIQNLISEAKKLTPGQHFDFMKDVRYRPFIPLWLTIHHQQADFPFV